MWSLALRASEEAHDSLWPSRLIAVAFYNQSLCFALQDKHIHLVNKKLLKIIYNNRVSKYDLSFILMLKKDKELKTNLRTCTEHEKSWTLEFALPSIFKSTPKNRPGDAHKVCVFLMDEY